VSDFEFTPVPIERAMAAEKPEPEPEVVAPPANYKVEVGEIDIPGIGTIYYPLAFCQMPHCPHTDKKHPFSFICLPEPLEWWVHSGCYCPTLLWWDNHFRSVVHVEGTLPWEQ
jgi:hypothetical protein